MSKLRTFSVTLPIAGHAFLYVEAEDEKAAINKAMETVTRDDIEEWEALESFTRGNVCYCPSPWEAKAEEHSDKE